MSFTNIKDLKDTFKKLIDNEDDRFHPLVLIHGQPELGNNIYVGAFSEINARHSSVKIGNNCDIASFVSINVADSHKRVLGLSEEIERKPIVIENNVFIGSHSFVKAGAHIGHHSVVAAGTMVNGVAIPPYSLIYGNPMQIKEGYYKKYKKLVD
ncbi:acyltransferase [Candidatus Woesearchaeota archaeon]|nr:acyltransferase [Candidatus Woesearchaeota archaeon]